MRYTPDFDPKTEFRNLKFKLLDGAELDFSIRDDIKNKFSNELRFIKAKCQDDIITGSLALNLYGFISRGITDIDLLIKDKSRYSYYSDTHNMIYHIMKEDNPKNNRLGYVTLKYKDRTFYNLFGAFSYEKEYLVDFFENIDNEFETFKFEGHEYKIQSLLEIIDIKSKLYEARKQDEYSDAKAKHHSDLYNIFLNIKYK